MTRARDVSRLITTPPNIYATDSEASSAGYLTNASASTIYATISSNKIVQVVSAMTTSGVNISTSSWTDTNLTATITPTSASNKILVIISHNGCGKQSNNTTLNLRLLRAATTITEIEGIGGYTANSGTNFFGGISFNYLDSPTTIAATTYKTQFRSETNNAAVLINWGSSSGITLMEVAP
jgi:hypothetical protein